MCFYEIYFSPTGGTKKVADAIAAGIDGDIRKIDLIKSPQEMEKIVFTKEDLCLVAVPSYGGRVPGVVVEQLKQVKGNGAKVILAAVFGNRHIDDTLLELSDTLKAAGFVCVAGIEAVAEHSLVHRFGAGRPDAEDVKELTEFGKKILSALDNGTCKTEPSLPGSHAYKIYNGVAIKPEVNEKCSQCGACALECPANAIPKENPGSTNKERCISCMHCVSICPNHAREFSKALVLETEKRIEAACAGRKENKLYL